MPDSPIFIVGCGRSGTTLLRLILNRNSNIAIPEETWFFPTLYRALPLLLEERDWRSRVAQEIVNLNSGHFPNLHPNDILPALDEIEKDNEPSIVSSLNRSFAHNEGKTRWGDKTPGYVMHLELLHKLWPEARIIHMIRDPRDVVPSILSYWEVGPQTNNPLEVIWYWKKQVATGMREGPKYFGDRYLEVRFEDFVAHPEEKLQEVCGHIGAAYEPEMLAYYQTAERYVAPWGHHDNASRPVDASMAFKWKQRPEGMPYQTFFAVTTNKLLEELGYEKI